MAWGAIVATILGIAFITGTIIWGLSYNKKLQKVDVPMNAPIVINLCKTEHTKGYATGVLNSIRENKNGTYLVIYAPTDVEQGEGIPRPEMQKVDVLKNNIITLPLGEPSARRQIMFLTSSDPTKYPDRIRKTLEYNMMLNSGIQAYLKDIFGEDMRERDKSIAKQVVESAGGQVSAHTFGQMEEQMKKYRNIINQMKEQSKGEEEKS